MNTFRLSKFECFRGLGKFEKVLPDISWTPFEAQELRVNPNKMGLNVQRNPLVWALPLQALLLLSNLDLLDPWGDEWFTLTTVPQPLSQVVSTDPGMPSAALLRAAALLDSTPLDGKSAG